MRLPALLVSVHFSALLAVAEVFAQGLVVVLALHGVAYLGAVVTLKVYSCDGRGRYKPELCNLDVDIVVLLELDLPALFAGLSRCAEVHLEVVNRKVSPAKVAWGLLHVRKELFFLLDEAAVEQQELWPVCLLISLSIPCASVRLILLALPAFFDSLLPSLFFILVPGQVQGNGWPGGVVAVWVVEDHGAAIFCSIDMLVYLNSVYFFSQGII